MTNKPRYEAPAAVLTREASEADWQATILDAAQYTGWHLALRVEDAAYRELSDKIRDGGRGRGAAMKAAAGLRAWPDLTLIHPVRGLTLFVEVKRATGKLTEAQFAALALLLAGGQFAYVWRPEDWSLVESLLSGRLEPVMAECRWRLTDEKGTR